MRFIAAGNFVESVRPFGRCVERGASTGAVDLRGDAT